MARGSLYVVAFVNLHSNFLELWGMHGIGSRTIASGFARSQAVNHSLEVRTNAF